VFNLPLLFTVLALWCRNALETFIQSAVVSGGKFGFETMVGTIRVVFAQGNRVFFFMANWYVDWCGGEQIRGFVYLLIYICAVYVNCKTRVVSVVSVVYFNTEMNSSVIYSLRQHSSDILILAYFVCFVLLFQYSGCVVDSDVIVSVCNAVHMIQT